MSTDTSLTFTSWVSDLARYHTHALVKVARAEGVTAEDALDAVQEAFETFLQFPRARSLVGSQEDSRALLIVLVRNVARDLRRRHHRARPHDDIEALRELAEPIPAVEDVLRVAEDHVRLQGCVDRLGRIQRLVVKMRMLEEVSGSEVASNLELKPGHVAVLLHRAKKDLLLCMTEKGDGWWGRMHAEVEL